MSHPGSGDKELATRPVKRCPCCGGTGNDLYSGMRDLLFGAPGVWNFKECSNSKCAHIWLDPVPIEEDIHKAYKNYYTHAGESGDGYTPFWFKKLSVVAKAIAAHTVYNRLKRISMGGYLNGVQPGRLLELGCGDGKRLLFLREMGWQVEGQEVDPDLIKSLRRDLDVKIHEGDLLQLSLDADCYDAVIMNHVIEHLYEPLSVLRECWRILKPGGRLVAVTPNALSLGHLLYRKSWRGLEPPRHINVFNPRSLSVLAAESGFSKHSVKTVTVNGWIIMGESSRIKYRDGMRLSGMGKIRHYGKAVFFQLLEGVVNLFSGERGEECVLVVIK